jgi:hypothetical protein
MAPRATPIERSSRGQTKAGSRRLFLLLIPSNAPRSTRTSQPLNFSTTTQFAQFNPFFFPVARLVRHQRLAPSHLFHPRRRPPPVPTRHHRRSSTRPIRTIHPIEPRASATTVRHVAQPARRNPAFPALAPCPHQTCFSVRARAPHVHHHRPAARFHHRRACWAILRRLGSAHPRRRQQRRRQPSTPAHCFFLLHGILLFMVTTTAPYRAPTPIQRFEPLFVDIPPPF